MNENSVTIWIAFYGAILSSFVLGWNLFRDLTDKGKLRVYCYIGKIVTSTGLIDQKDYLVFNVTNTGRRPVNVVQVGGKKKEGQFVIVPRGLPRMLQPTEGLSEFASDLSALDNDLECLCAWDSLGNKYKMKRKELRELIKKAKTKQAK